MPFPRMALPPIPPPRQLLLQLLHLLFRQDLREAFTGRVEYRSSIPSVALHVLEKALPRVVDDIEYLLPLFGAFEFDRAFDHPREATVRPYRLNPVETLFSELCLQQGSDDPADDQRDDKQNRRFDARGHDDNSL